jgi:radical SAM superfamily enzyme YgiQ (UPF0313 family)
MNILLISPETPTTFWSFRNALKFISKKSSEPPLGLLTIAAMLPDTWKKKLVDMNVSRLENRHIDWADYVFITGMNIQLNSFKEVIKRCNELETPVVAGGPMCTTEYHELEGVHHFILNEAEITLPQFLSDLETGNPKPLYMTNEFPDISGTPVPRWDLLEMKKYATMSIQYSRGCPFDCEFCSITMLNGHRPRTKSKEQFLNELETLYSFGWRGAVFIVDDNFIGNKKKLKSETLPALIEWSSERNYPFHFITEASINLADDEELLRLMVKAGFDSAFIGIESPNINSISECGKTPNKNRDILAAVKKLQRFGLIISGGFIVGFDNDPKTIFEQQINFIQKSGIVTAMVGLLNAPKGTRLFQRLKAENRLLARMTGDNMDGSINFVPKMNYQKLVDGYSHILKTIYSHKEYYARVKTLITEYHLPDHKPFNVTLRDIKALFRSFLVLGVLEKGRRYFWNLVLFSLIKHPQKFSIAITMAIYGFHFRRVVETV